MGEGGNELILHIAIWLSYHFHFIRTEFMRIALFSCLVSLGCRADGVRIHPVGKTKGRGKFESKTHGNSG